jgi:hypothetical protein
MEELLWPNAGSAEMQKLMLMLLLLSATACSTRQLDNSTLLYGTTGLPKNCRAIIKAGIDGYRTKQYTADDVLASIDRNCGEFGLSWER